MKIKGLEKELAPIMVGTSSALFTDETTPWIPTNLTREEQFAVVDELWDMEKTRWEHIWTQESGQMKR